MAIIQAPLIYYYTSGLFAFIVLIPYLIMGLALTVWLLTILLKSKNSVKTRFQKIGVILTISIGSLTLFFGEDLIEKLDWHLRKNQERKLFN